MTIFILGNPDLAIDALPVRLLPQLQTALPQHQFVFVDPNEEWDAPAHCIVIDTVLGIKDVTVFDSLQKFQNTPRVSLHGFDALFHLRMLDKLGKITSIKIIGIPPTILEKDAVQKITQILHPNSP